MAGLEEQRSKRVKIQCLTVESSKVELMCVQDPWNVKGIRTLKFQRGADGLEESDRPKVF
ncbi:hypothetical protein PG995_004959 [Apiospora arundinis]